MARYSCPSCGSIYNGKKCRQCLYEHFTEEIAHGTHVHEGEPLVIDAPMGRAIKRKDPFGCEKRTRKKHPFAGFLVLLAIINSLLPMLRNWGLELEAIEDRYIAAEPEPMVIPENCTVLYDDGEVAVYAQWEQGQTFDERIPVYIKNDSRRDMIVQSRSVVVNGFLMEYSTLFSSLDRGSTEMVSFCISDRDRNNCGIEAVAEITFYLELHEEGDYDNVLSAEPVTLRASVPQTAVLFTEPQGQTVFAQDNIRVDYLGYDPNPYHPEDFGEGNFLFYVENATDHSLLVYLTETSLNGEAVGISLWYEMPPNTRGVTGAFLYDLGDPVVHSSEELTEVSFRLNIDTPGLSEYSVQTELICISQP